MSGKPTTYNILLFLLVLLENTFFFFTYKNGYLDSGTNAICYSVVSLLIGIVLILKYYNKKSGLITASSVSTLKKYAPACILFVLATIWAAAKAYPIITTMPVDFRMSDIIPTVQILAKRFIAHQNPYDRNALLPLGYTIPSTYLPMHWLPYTIAEFVGFDYRWVTFAIWAIGFFILMHRLAKSQPVSAITLAALMISGAYFLITDKDSSIISLTIETMVAGYYMIFIASLNTKNAYLHGLAIGICLLSRYTLILWLPLWAFILFVSENRQYLYKSMAAAVAFVLLLYILPFLSKDWAAFYDAHMAYENGAIGEWFHVNEKHLPYHLFNGVGLAQFFYLHYQSTDLHIGYTVLRSIMFISLLSASAIIAVWYWINRTKIDYRIILMASFKIYLTLFFALIMVPYNYLIVVGNFVSIAIFIEQLRYKTNQRI